MPGAQPTPSHHNVIESEVVDGGCACGCCLLCVYMPAIDRSLSVDAVADMNRQRHTERTDALLRALATTTVTFHPLNEDILQDLVTVCIEIDEFCSRNDGFCSKE